MRKLLIKGSSPDSPNRYDICLMTMDKQDKFVEQVMVNHNMSMIAAREATQASEGLVMEQEVFG
jgi:hypothetical protein